MKILSAEFVTSATGPKQFPGDAKPQIAFAGRSNVGKSSLINALLRRKNLVKTSATPGKTQLINFFIINDRFYFVDLPGYGYARAPRSVVETWAPMIEAYFKDAPQLRAVVVLLDSRRTPDDRDKRLVEWLRHYRIPAVYVLTKTDKLKKQEIVLSQRHVTTALDLDAPPILTSARSGLGMKELWAKISTKLSR
jgi:GTP-binding protein